MPLENLPAAWVGLLLAASSPPADPAMGRIEPLARIAPAPLPKSLPMVGGTGSDPHGYPLSVVDGAALRSLLLHARFADLTAYLEQLQADFEADARREFWPLEAAEALGSAETEVLEVLDAWAAASPGSFAPYLARGFHWIATGWELRGADFAANTSAAQFATMGLAFGRAELDLRHALELRPTLAAARVGLLRISLGGGKETLRREILQEALRRCPTCFEVRNAYIVGLLPRWGGSHEEMESFAREAQDAPNSRLRLLAGVLDMDRSVTLDWQGSHEEAVAAATRACEAGENWEFFLNRGALKRDHGDIQAALQDFERAAVLRPGNARVLFARALAHAKARQWEPAALDVIAGLRINPVGTRVKHAIDSLVKGLIYAAWQHEQASRLGDALRVYDLAADLAPTDRDVLSRRSAAIIGDSRRAPDTLARVLEVALQFPDDFQQQRKLSYILNGQKKSEEAIALWARFLQRQPQHGRAHLEYATTLRRAGRNREALIEAGLSCDLGTSEACGWAHAVAHPKR